MSVYFVRTAAPVEEVELRLLRREREGASVSDARAVILPRFLAEWEEPDEAEKALIFEAYTGISDEEVLRNLFKKFVDALLGK